MRIEEIEEIQSKVNLLIAALPAAIAAGEETVLSWTGDFAIVNDYISLRFDKSALVNQLEEAGYRWDEFDRTIVLPTDGPEAHRRAIISVALRCLRNGMPIPEKLSVHIDYHFDTVGKKRPKLW
ncbi:MAG: hypothetical protein SGJ27_06920 [Candidatus Melainabacteria bacterium]|nr:hypothetical protein [Candidatus Melainabacteria bacterium]